MKQTGPLSIIFIVSLVLFAAGFACNNTGSSTSDSGPANTAAANTASSSNTASTTSTPAKKVDISGTYDATGTNPNGGGTYKAELTVTPHDDVYQFSWESGKSSYDGVGVMTDNEVAVSYTDGASGKGCGVVLYKIGSDGSLDGKIGYWGVNSMETERATRTKGSGSDLDGVYEITGKNPEGKEYKGTLTVIKSGEGYTFDWDAGNAFSGFGIKADDLVAVGFGGKQCAFVGYDVQPDGTLDGRWGSQTSKSLGTEVAKKKK